MRKHKIFGIGWLVIVSLIGHTIAEGAFEDAEKSNDFQSSNTNQHFDLRHTIPGEPDIDYPIYSVVPKTSFKCTGRHEGYYADMESRCQAFRICTHTARSAQGFGFLCPNGTLFSQKNFVCDWYRNVNCDDSERFYNKNSANRVGSSYDMMETVRQMMEYPMKTISKALQKNSSTGRRPTHGHHTLSKELESKTEDDSSASQKNTRTQSQISRKTAVTRAQVESAYNYGENKETDSIQTHAHSTEEGDQQQIVGISSSGLSALKHSKSVVGLSDDDDVFVNSLGELSTDVNTKFDRTNAHIIAEPKIRTSSNKRMNFAEKVNAGLNDLAELPANEVLAPDYVKRLRSTNDQEATQTDLASNINGLLDEIASDLDPSLSGYHVPTPQKSKHSFRFLSRGFSSQNNAKDGPYVYGKPKQTESTVKFTPNELPIDHNKDSSHKTHNTFKIADDAVEFTFMTTTAPEAPINDEETYLIAPTLPPLLDVDYLSPPLLAPLEPIVIPNTEETDQTGVTETSIVPTYASLSDSDITTTTTDSPEIVFSAPNLESTQKMEKTEELIVENDNVELPIDEEKLSVNEHAASLFLAGVKLTTSTLNENVENNNIQNISTHPNAADIASGNNDDDISVIRAALDALNTETAVPQQHSIPTSTPMSTSTETVTEISSTQERIRSYRRFATLQRASMKPMLYANRAHVRSLTKSPTSGSTVTTTTAKPSTTTTRSYLKRVAASRLRLSRLANGRGTGSSTTSTTTTSSPPNRKISVRNLDKETGITNDLASVDTGSTNRGVATWESVRQNLQRFQVNRKRSGNTDGYSYTTAAPVTKTSKTDRTSQLRSRNRFSNFKTQSVARSSHGQMNIIATTATPYTPQLQSQAPSPQQHHTQVLSNTLPQSSSYIPSSTSLNYLNSAFDESQMKTHMNAIRSADTNSNAATASSSTSSSSSSSTSSSSSSFLSFDKLTRAIVDDSVLQNFRSSQALTHSSPPYQAALSVASSSSSVVTPKSVFGSHSAFTTARPTVSSPGLSYEKRQPQEPPQLILPQRPQYLPALQAVQPTVVAFSKPTPRIVIARAEGQRIEPNSVSSVISSLATQKQSSGAKGSGVPYVPLESFLTNKFGNNAPTTNSFNYMRAAPTTAATFFGQQQQQQQQQHATQNQVNYGTQQYQKQAGQHQQSQSEQQREQPLWLQKQLQQQQQQQQQQIPKQQQNYYQQKQENPYLPPQQLQQQSNQVQSNLKYQQHQQNNQHQQHQPQNQIFTNLQFQAKSNQEQQQQQQQQQHPFMTQNIFATYQQQQKQLPQFPPLAASPTSSSSLSSESQPVGFGGNSAFEAARANFLNVQLPALPNGLIPAPTTQVAQKRSDTKIGQLQLSSATTQPRSSSVYSVFDGASSYEVPLSSIGRLPNDITHLLRRLRKY